jgi:hypothetical protein
MQKYLFVLAISAAFLVSCSKTSPAKSELAISSQPKTGSTFTFDQYYIDTTTGQPIANTRDTTTETIVQTGLTYLGKTNVSKVVAATKHGIDTSYLCFEPNGDISINSAYLKKWITMPTGSKSSMTMTMDTIFGSSKIELKMVSTTSFIGDETLTMMGRSVSVTKLKQSSDITMINSGTQSTSNMTMFFYYAPSLGFITKSETPVSTDQKSGAKSKGRMNMLIDYSLK